MHELSLMADLLRRIESVLNNNDATRAVGVTVKLGALAFISAEHFREHFEEGTRGTRIEGAKLEIETSEDMTDPHAQDILLASVEIEK